MHLNASLHTCEHLYKQAHTHTPYYIYHCHYSSTPHLQRRRDRQGGRMGRRGVENRDWI